MSHLVKTPIKTQQCSYRAPTALLPRDYSTLANRLQHIYRMLISKMIEYLRFLLLCTLVALLGAAACYLYSLLKMAKASIDDLLPDLPYDPPKSDVKREKLIECVLTGNSKQYLGKADTEEQVNELSVEEVDKLFSYYEVKLSRQIVKSLGKSIIRMYSMAACPP